MAARVTLIFATAFVVFLALTWQSDATAIRRDVSETSSQSAGQTIDQAIQSFKDSLDSLVKDIQGNEVYQNVTRSLKDFGEQVQSQGQQLINKVHNVTQRN